MTATRSANATSTMNQTECQNDLPPAVGVGCCSCASRFCRISGGFTSHRVQQPTLLRQKLAPLPNPACVQAFSELAFGRLDFAPPQEVTMKTVCAAIFSLSFFLCASAFAQ